MESYIIDTFMEFVLKLNENTFQPMFLKLVQWANDENQGSSLDKARRTVCLNRQITFCRIYDTLLDRLKSFVTRYFVFASELYVRILLEIPDRVDNVAMTRWKYAMISLSKSMHYDEDSEVWQKPEAVNQILPVLVKQLINVFKNETDEEYLSRMNDIVIPCVGDLAIASNSDVHWKSINNSILLESRHDNPIIRLAIVRAAYVCYDRIGEDYLVLLPETIPFLAELLEDDDERVERETQKLCQRIEKILGEPIQKYFQ